MSRLPEELERIVVAAGFANLKAWCAAAGVSAGGVTAQRCRGAKVGQRTLSKLIAASKTEVDADMLRAALLVPPRPEARR